MKLIDKYIFKQVALATFIGLIAFLVVWISPEILFKIIKKAIDGQISGYIALKLFFLEIPEILSNIIPATLMLGSLWAFDRLSKDSELTIFRGIGISFRRLAVPVLSLSIIGAFACFVITNYLVPYSQSSLKVLKQNVYRDYFVFLDRTKEGKPDHILIIGDYDGKNARNIKFFSFSEKVSDEAPLIKSIITAQAAVYKNNTWSALDGMEYEIAPDGVYKNIKRFKNTDILKSNSAKNAYDLLSYSLKKTKQMKIKELSEYVSLLRTLDMQTEYRYMLNKLYQRFSQPFSCILFSLCGIILGFSKPREKKFLGFTIGIALIFLCMIIVPFADMLAQIGVLPPIIAAWIPSLIIITAIWALLKYKKI